MGRLFVLNVKSLLIELLNVKNMSACAEQKFVTRHFLAQCHDFTSPLEHQYCENLDVT